MPGRPKTHDRLPPRVAARPMHPVLGVRPRPSRRLRVSTIENSSTTENAENPLNTETPQSTENVESPETVETPAGDESLEAAVEPPAAPAVPSFAGAASGPRSSRR